jgi:hypothetical protein
VEWYGEATSPSMPFQHASLQQPTPQEAWLFARYANGSLPFMDIGNRYLVPMAQDAGRWVVFSSPPDRFMEVFHQSAVATTHETAIALYGRPGTGCFMGPHL